MQVKDLNEILKRCNFNSVLNKKPVNSGGSYQEFLQMAYMVMLTKDSKNWTNDTKNIIEAIRYLAIAIYLLENEE